MRQEICGGTLDIEGNTGQFQLADQTYEIVASPRASAFGRLRSNFGVNQWWSVSVTELSTRKRWSDDTFTTTANHAIWNAAFNIALARNQSAQTLHPTPMDAQQPADGQIGRSQPAPAHNQVAAISKADPAAAYAAWKRGDYATAFRLLRPLADQGDARSQCLLGISYMSGWGVTQDYAEAAKWFKAAYRGNGDESDSAGVYLGEFYCQGLMQHEGRDVRGSLVQAHMWFNLTAARSPPGEVRDAALKWRDRLEREKLTPGEVVEAQRLAREWQPNGTEAASDRRQTS